MAKCAICQKKMGPLGFECPCSAKVVFCEKHRLREDHACPLINAKGNVILPLVVADKLKYRV